MRVSTTLFISLCVLADGVISASLVRRAEKVCSGPTAKSNNGDRKMAIVIDSSDSMYISDPTDLRLQAGKSILDWLITKDEVADTKKEDAVAIIDFADEARLDYKLGPPEDAYAPLANITANGGTYIASGVKMAIEQLTASGTGNTKDRSGILVFTDGEDGYVDELQNQIKSATNDGIRVSFGYLSGSSAYQNPDILRAIMNSGGKYYGIYDALSSRNFINAILVNGLTRQDNPNDDKSVLLSGLEAAQYIKGTETQTMSYGARAKEQLEFTITSVDAETLEAAVMSGKKTLASSKFVTMGLGDTLSVVAPSDGNIDVKVTAHGANDQSIFLVGVTSNLPPENCTVGIGDKPGKTNKAVIIGPAVGVPLLAIVGLGSYFIWKHFHNGGGHGGGPNAGGPNGADAPEYSGDKAPGYSVSAVPPPHKPSNWFKDMFKFPEHGVPPPPPPPPPPPSNSLNNKQTGDQNNDDGKQTGDEPGSEYDDVEVEDETPQDPNQPPDGHKKHTRLHRMRIYGNNHHHHVGPEHPCYNEKCPLNKSDHVCDSPQYPCTCVDPKCKLNSRLHFCSDDNAPNHKCPGPKENPYCPLNDPPYMEAKKKEHNELVRKYMAQDAAKAGVKMAVNYGIRALAL